MPEHYPPGTYLGFDYGHKFIGIAVGQSISKSASPLAIIKTSKNEQWQKIDELVKEWNPVGMVIGMPETADGNTTAIHKMISGFIDQLRHRYRIETFQIDERLSSYAASDLLSSSTKRKIPRLDDTAAAVILETWLAEHL